MDQVNLATPFVAVQNPVISVQPNPGSNCILPTRNSSVNNSLEIQCEETGPPKYQTSLKSDVESHVTCSTSKQFVLRLPQGTLNKLSLPANSSGKANISTPAGVSKHTLPQPSPQVPTHRSPHTKLSFVCSGLHTGLIARVKALSKLLGAEFSNKFESHTTHLIVKASDTMTADKTLKYLLAVVKKKWIVSIAWVNACLQARKLVQEVSHRITTILQLHSLQG